MRNGKKKKLEKKQKKTKTRTVQVRRRRRDDPLRPNPHRDVVEQRLRELLPQRGDLRFCEIGPQKPHAAVDIKTNAAGRDDGLGVGRVKGGDVADGEAVARMQVRHGQRGADDPRERCDVGDLLDGREEAPASGLHVSVFAARGARGAGDRVCELVVDERLEGVVDVKQAGDSHVGHEAAGD